MKVARHGTLLLISLLLGACGGDDGVSDMTDAGTFADASVPPSEARDCYDNVDNDENGVTDCRDLACAASTLCCVGSGNDGCCESTGTSVTLSLAGCGDGDASACLGSDPSIVLFGAPIIENSALVPQGGLGHGGVVLGSPIDPRAGNIELIADIDAPPTRCSDCVDGAGIALLETLPAADGSAIVPLGVLASGARNEVLVLVGDEPVARTALATGVTRYRIELDVEGNARVYAGSELLTSVGGIRLPTQALPAVFGRTANRPAGVAAISVQSASVTTRACDAPSALVRRSAPVLPWSGATWSPREVRRPSVVVWDEGTTRHALMAFAFEGQVHLAGRTGIGEFRNALGDPGPPAFTLPAELAAARDPWLAIDGDHFVIFFVGVDADGATSVWRSDGEPAYSETFGAPVLVLSPSTLSVDAIDGPSVLADTSTWTMIARVHVDESHHLVELVSQDGVGWGFRNGTLEAATIRSPQDLDLFAVDRDEVAAPAIIVRSDPSGVAIRRLYYAARRGTHWSIALLVSEPSAPTVWRALSSVLEPGSGFDLFAVSDPAPVVEDGILRLFYAGSDGTTFRIGVAGPVGTLGE